MHTLQLHIDKLPVPIDYQSHLLLIGSCFADNMAARFQQHKFHVLSNPHGTLFNPLSVAYSLDSYIEGKIYDDREMFFLNEIWNSWEHHSDFSDIDKHTALQRINDSQRSAAEFIKTATHMVITLGSSFYYHHIENDKPVSNNHRAPAQWFEKRLLTVQQTVDAFTHTLDEL